jgi:hypothetical protein
VVAFNQLRLEYQSRRIEKDNIKAVDKEVDYFFRTGNDYFPEVFTVLIVVSYVKQKRDQDTFQTVMARPPWSGTVLGIFTYRQKAGDKRVTFLKPGQIDIKRYADIFLPGVKIMGVLVHTDKFAFMQRELFIFIVELNASLKAEYDLNDILVHVRRDKFYLTYF